MMTSLLANIVFFGILGMLVCVACAAVRRAITIAQRDAENAEANRHSVEHIQAAP